MSSHSPFRLALRLANSAGQENMQAGLRDRFLESPARKNKQKSSGRNYGCPVVYPLALCENH